MPVFTLRLTWSVATGKDVADTLIGMAETGEDAEGTRVTGGCDLIVLATHGEFRTKKIWAVTLTED